MNYEKILTDKIVEEILSKGVRDMPQNPSAQGYSERQVRGFYYIPEQEILNVIKKIEDVLEETLKNVINVDTELNLNSKNALSNEKTTQELYRRGLFGSEAPTTKTEGELGQIYTNSATGDRFVCVSINSNGYNWLKIPTIADVSSLDSKTSKATNIENGEAKESLQIKDEKATNSTTGRGGINLGRYGFLDTNYGFITGYLNRLRNRVGAESTNSCGFASGHGNYGRGLHNYMFGQYQIANTYNCFMSGYSELQNHTKKIYADQKGVQWSIEDIMENNSLSESDRAELLRNAWLYNKDKKNTLNLFQCITTPQGAMETSISTVDGSNNFCFGKSCSIKGNANYIGKYNHNSSIKGRECMIFDVEMTSGGVQNNHACINLIGDGLKTYGNTEGGMLIIGSFNAYDKTKDGRVKFQIGNGKSDTERSNALTVYEDGTVEGNLLGSSSSGNSNKTKYLHVFEYTGGTLGTYLVYVPMDTATLQGESYLNKDNVQCDWWDVSSLIIPGAFAVLTNPTFGNGVNYDIGTLDIMEIAFDHETYSGLYSLAVRFGDVFEPISQLTLVSETVI